MKSQEFGSVLKSYAHILATLGLKDEPDQLLVLAGVFETSANASVAATIKRASAMPVVQTVGTPSVGDAAVRLGELRELFARATKPSVLVNIDVVLALLRHHSKSDLEVFVDAVRTTLTVKPGRSKKAPASPVSDGRTRRKGGETFRSDLVAAYREKLEAQLGDEQAFTEAFQELSSNSEIGKEEILALAKELTGSRSKSKAGALKKIWQRHQSLMAFKAKSRATGGRSAA